MPSKKSKPKEPTERVFLIDSFSHIFRAFFAPMGARTEPLTNSRGQVTQAVFVETPDCVMRPDSTWPFIVYSNL